AHVAGAFEAGAAAAVVADPPNDLDGAAPLMRVDDTLDALQKLGLHRRAHVDARICAVTGSVGKTGTKEALHLALSRSGKSHASIKSFNNHWGVPLSLARMPRDARYAVFEIGMNHAGEITPLTKMVRPNVAIVTTVEPVHLEFFSSEENIADAKGEIFIGLEPGGVAILNRDNRHFERLKRHAERAGAARIIGFGEHEQADVRLVDCALKSNFSCVSASILGQEVTWKLGAPGRHQVMNSLAVMAAVEALGGDLALAGLALAELTPPDGRGRRASVQLDGGAFEVIDESYNANPASMAAAIETLGFTGTKAGGRRIAVLGDMLELGGQSPEFHSRLTSPLESAGVDLVFCCGPLMKHLWEALPESRKGGYAPASDELARMVAREARPGDVFMVKGSFGSRMQPIVDALLSKGRDYTEAPGTLT
ncbi:MAG: UDP-N-acetylmuramoylalanyl-D-glutamyl-2,6-diaminopimelate--D-alanyl-D-alanine ligase, partial [Alphaproteobacteria bacterium]